MTQSLNIKQFRYASDNLGYLVYGKQEAIAIDGGAVGSILSFLETERLTLKWVTNTHAHGDHTTGNRPLLEATRAVHLDHQRLSESEPILLEGSPIVVHATPGHTLDSVSFHLDGVLITGDTLFNGTVGNCFSGDLKGFYASIKKLMALPENTCVYAGHDYVRDAMTVARRIEPANPAIDPFLAAYSPDHVKSSIDDEHRVNPYVRFNAPSIIAFLEKNGLPVDTEFHRWTSIMSID